MSVLFSAHVCWPQVVVLKKQIMLDAWMSGWMDRCFNDGWISGWLDGWMDGCTKAEIKHQVCSFLENCIFSGDFTCWVDSHRFCEEYCCLFYHIKFHSLFFSCLSYSIKIRGCSLSEGSTPFSPSLWWDSIFKAHEPFQYKTRCNFSWLY